mmetsp:Transcript_933/g.571  ORF Transcript_933/g.571 Transcript_933/m.571 type:complete len:125 (+) Transcript_933:393-767(+)
MQLSWLLTALSIIFYMLILYYAFAAYLILKASAILNDAYDSTVKLVRNVLIHDDYLRHVSKIQDFLEEQRKQQEFLKQYEKKRQEHRQTNKKASLFDYDHFAFEEEKEERKDNHYKFDNHLLFE